MKSMLHILIVISVFICVAVLLSPNASAATVASGKCGTDVTWTLDDEGLLTISGRGAMDDYSNSVNKMAPWASNRSNIKSVEIKSGVTSIGECTFLGCSKLTSITIPDSVTSIGSYALCNCSWLTSVTIPGSVTSIGEHAFSGCSGLTIVTIPNSVTSIGDYAFYECSGLSNVTIGNGVTSIGYNAFLNCSGLTKVEISDIDAWCRIAFDEIYANPMRYAKIILLNGEEITEVTIPDDITKLNYTFMNFTHLKKVVIPDNITSIGSAAFSSCTGLTSVTIPDSVTSIGNSAFDGCSGLTSVTIGTGIMSIGRYAFYEINYIVLIFEGNAPDSVGTRFIKDTGIILFMEGKSGWTAPNWKGYAAAMIKDISGTPSLDLANGSIEARQAGETYYYVQNGTAYRSSKNAAVIRQTGNTTPTENTVLVRNGDFKLSIVDINISTDKAAIQTYGKLTLNLMGTCTLVSKADTSYDSSIVCVQLSGADSELIIEGSGTLNITAESKYRCTAIGIMDKDCGNISIKGGTINITAIADVKMAIGAQYGKCGDIVVEGATLHINKGVLGAQYGECRKITILNSSVTFDNSYYYCTIGCGSGYSVSSGSSCGKISIDNSTVSCLLIGSDAYSSCGEITITNSTLSAEYIGSSSDYNYDNGYGSDSVTIENVEYKGSKPKTYELIHYEAQLPDTAAHVGNVPALSVTATGHSGLSFQWQVSSNGSSWTDVSGQTGATFNSPMTAAKSGSYYRCKITNGWGNTVYTDAARVFVLAFNKQPQSVLTDLDELASLSVEPSCANVTYQWERSYDGGETWTTVPGEVFSTLLVNATLSENSALYRCVITATNGDSLTSDAAEIKINVRGLVTYTTRYYLEKADGSGYDLAAQNVLEGTEGQTVTAAEKTFEFYTEEKDKAVATGTVKKDGSLVLARYYARQTFTMSFDTDGGTIMSPTRLRFGAEIPELADPTKAGYVFEGWYADEELSEPFTLKTMPTENIVIYAKWKLVGDGRGIEYKINGIVLRDAEYKEITEIPRGKFFAEVSVANLSSKTMDVVILATYNAQGQMTGMHYLFANPQIGQTFALGTRLDNSKGDIASIKAFVVPILGGLVPLADAVELG